MREIVELLKGYALPSGAEERLQEVVEQILIENNVQYVREKRLSATDRIDFLVGEVGIECKVDGSPSAVYSQLLRYAESDEVASLILLTTRNTHRFPSGELLKKPFHLIRVSGL